MNTQTVSQRFRSVRCFVREMFAEMFYSNFEGYVWRHHVCVPRRGTNIAVAKLTKTYVIEFAISSSSEGSKLSVSVLILIQGLFRLRNLS